MNYRTRRKLVSGFLIGTPLVIITSFTLFPIYWTIVTSLKLENHIQHRPVLYFPPEPTFKHFIFSWQAVKLGTYFMNSTIVALLSMLFVVILAVMAAYPITRFNFKGKKVVLLSMLATQFLPQAMLLIPLFLIFVRIGIINTLACVVIAVVAFQFPFITVLMTGFMSRVPHEIEEAARIDGCNRVQSIIHIVLPMLIPGIVAAGSFAFIDGWKEYLFPLMFIMDSSKYTLSVGLASMITEFRTSFGPIAAGCVIAMTPPILLFAYMQRYLVSGLSTGAVKG